MLVKKFYNKVIVLLIAIATLFCGTLTVSTSRNASASVTVNNTGYTDEELEDYIDAVMGDLSNDRNYALQGGPLVFVDSTLCPEIMDCETVEDMEEVLEQSVFFNYFFQHISFDSEGEWEADLTAENIFSVQPWLFIYSGYDEIYYAKCYDTIGYIDLSDEETLDLLYDANVGIFGLCEGLPNSSMYNFFHTLQDMAKDADQPLPPVYPITDDFIPFAEDGLHIISFETQTMSLNFESWYFEV